MRLLNKILCSLFVIGILTFSNSALAQTVVKSLRTNDLPKKQQIVVDVENATNFHSFTLPNPPRIVVDIDVDKITKFPKILHLNPKRVVSNVRTGIQSGSTIRVVVDLLEKASWEVYAMKPDSKHGHRVVIDVNSKAGQVFKPMSSAKATPKDTAKPVKQAKTKPSVKSPSKTLPQPNLVLDTIDPENAIPVTFDSQPVQKERSLFGKMFGIFSSDKPENTAKSDKHLPRQQTKKTMHYPVAKGPGLAVNIPTGNRIYRFRANRHQQKVQFVVDLDKSPTFKAFKLENPTRLVIDVASQTAFPYKNLVGKGGFRGIKQVRQGVRSASVQRMVFDLAGDYHWEVTRLLPDAKRGHRLVVDIYDQPKKIPKPAVKPKPQIELSSAQKPKKLLELGTTQQKDSAASKASQRNLVRPDLITVMIDPGHGGRDSGATGAAGVKEKHITLDIAKRLKKKINKIKGMRAVLTRYNDKFMSLPRRSSLARKYKADLFVSIHADAFSQPEVYGSSVYVLSEEGSSESAELLAKSENAVDEAHGIGIEKYDDIGKVLFDIQQDATIESSYSVAKTLLKQLKTVGKLHKHGVERANFSVLRSPGIPSVLVETAFLSNPKEEKKLRSAKHRERVATVLAKGIKQYFEQYQPHHFKLINGAPKEGENGIGQN